MNNHKVIWTEGMFISPQHFQQNDRYFEHFTQEFIQQSFSQYDGLTTLDIDRSMLDIGKVVIRRAKGIFPDGTPFDIQKRLLLDIPSGTRNKKVYIALPLSGAGTIDFGEHLRYRRMEYSVFDITREHSDAITLDLAELNITLKLESEELQGYTLLAVAEIHERISEGMVVLNQAFVPQSLHFGVSAYLKDCLSDVYAQVQYRARTIATRLQAEGSSKSYQAQMRDYLWLHALGSWMPKLHQWNESGNLLTRELYLECISMAGQMQGLEGKTPTVFPLWNQYDQYRVFSAVFSELLLLLNEVQTDNVTTLVWDTQLFTTRRLLRTLVTDRSLYQHGRFIMAVTSSVGAVRLGKEFSSIAKLAGNRDIAGLVRNALSGIPLRHLPFAPSELKSRHDVAWFEVDTSAELWQSLVKNGDPIALHIDERIADINVEFHVIS